MIGTRNVKDFLRTSSIKPILNRIMNSEYPSPGEAYELFKVQGRDIYLLAYIADQVREIQVGPAISYVVNLNLNFTNVCTKNCLFCAYSVSPQSSNGFFEISEDFIAEKIKRSLPHEITEICIQGGIHPHSSFETYLQILRNLRRIKPKIHIHAFSPQEIHHAAQTADLTIQEVLKEFKKAGLDSMPGTAAEILDDEIRRLICPNKIKTAQWLDIIKTAHELTIPTTSTIMFGHIETPNHWIRHLELLKELQQETGGFTEFIPLPFVSKKTLLAQKYSSQLLCMTNLDYLKFYAISRLFLGEVIPNLQTSWVKLGFPLALMTLNAGCNDIGGTLFEENITRSAGGVYGQVVTPSEIQSLISTLGRPFKQRDTLYNYFNNPH